MSRKPKKKAAASAEDSSDEMLPLGDGSLETSNDAPNPEIEIPWLTALRILEQAHAYFQEKRGIGFGELIFKYQKGECKITKVETILGTSDCYRVQIMASGITIMDKPKGSK